MGAVTNAAPGVSFHCSSASNERTKRLCVAAKPALRHRKFRKDVESQYLARQQQNLDLAQNTRRNGGGVTRDEVHTVLRTVPGSSVCAARNQRRLAPLLPHFPCREQGTGHSPVLVSLLVSHPGVGSDLRNLRELFGGFSPSPIFYIRILFPPTFWTSKASKNQAIQSITKFNDSKSPPFPRTTSSYTKAPGLAHT